MYRQFLTGITAFGLTVFASTSHAANCAARDAVVDRLQTKYAEALTARGLQEFRNGSAVIEVWASEDTGTFTVLMTNAEGLSCIVAAGSHWYEETAPKATAPKGTRS